MLSIKHYGWLGYFLFFCSLQWKLTCMKSGKLVRVTSVPFGCPSVCPPVIQSERNRHDPEWGYESCCVTFQTSSCCSLSTSQSVWLANAVISAFKFHLPSLTSGEQIPACLSPSAHTETTPLFCHSSLLRWIYPASKGTVSLWSDDMNLIPRIKKFFS